MKKYLYVLVGLLSFIGVSTVKADTLTYNYLEDWYMSLSDYEEHSSFLIDSFSEATSLYYSDYASSYPYYVIDYLDNSFILVAFNQLPYIDYIENSTHPAFYGFTSYIVINCEQNSNCGFTGPYNGSAYANFVWSTIYRHYFYSNFDLYYRTSSNYDTIVINSYQDYPSLIINNNGRIPVFQSVLGLDYLSDPNSVNSSYIEVNLNDYAYIALSLKDYNQNSFSTVVYTKGQFCPTAVYNYGLTQKLYGSTDVCTPISLDFNPVTFYIKDNDIKNNAIYYIKAYDTSIDNIIKIDSYYFNISYITSENANNPYVNVNGKQYPTIPYDSLSSTATSNTENGYIPGQSENVFDITSDSDYITDLFSNPLQALKSAWVSIVAFFNLIATFIGLLPPTLSAFLIASFALSLILGVLKLIL